MRPGRSQTDFILIRILFIIDVFMRAGRELFENQTIGQPRSQALS